MPDGERVRIGIVQAALGGPLEHNVERTVELVAEAASRGAGIVVVPELFEGPYFCKQQSDEFFEWARPLAGHPTVERFRTLCRRLGVVVPVSFFERDGQAYYNSVAVVDADGKTLGIYRKSHIPDGPGYQEKFYFRPGDTGFRVWRTRFGALGVGICWDQWFPEAARAMMLLGADMLVYPSAIGDEPADPELDTLGPWQRAMIGHAVSNVVPVAASNRIGEETGQSFYGHSFLSNHRGEIVAEIDAGEEGVRVAEFDLGQIRRDRASFGFFRDRRPDLYAILDKSSARPKR